MLEKNHDYNDLLQKVPYFDSVIINFYLNPDRVNANEIEHFTRKRYTEKTKREMREHYLLTQNYVTTAKVFNVNEFTLRNGEFDEQFDAFELILKHDFFEKLKKEEKSLMKFDGGQTFHQTI